MKVLFFAQARSIAQCNEEDWTFEKPLNQEEFWKELIQRHPEMVKLKSSCRIACNGAYLEKDGVIGLGDEVALIPPVSGG